MPEKKKVQRVKITMVQAARLIGRARPTLSNWRKKPGAPFDAAGMCYIEELRAWAKEQGLLNYGPGGGQPLSGPPGGFNNPGGLGQQDTVALQDLTEEDQQLLEALVNGDASAFVKLASKVNPKLLNRLAAMGKTRAQLADADKKDLDNKKLRGELVEIAVVRGFWSQQIAVVKQHFQSLPGKLAARLVNKPYDEVYSVLETELRALLEGFARELPK